MKFTTDGLIIAVTKVGENDRAITALTRDNGLVRAFVHGALKPNGKNSAATALLCYSHLTFSKQKETYHVLESEVIDVFFGLRSDIEKLSLAQYFCELAKVMIPDGEESEIFLRLILNSLHFLATDKLDKYSVKAITELRIMTECGFMPDLIGCRSCGKDTVLPLYLDLKGGDMLCKECKAGVTGDFAELSPTAFTAMRHIAYSELQKLYSFSLPDEQAKYLSAVTERYLSAQTGHKFKTLEFFHSLETLN